MNRSELRAAIARKKKKKKDLAAALGITPFGFSKKLKGETEFKESEIRKLVVALDLTATDVNRIFLS